jgi:hypothetical protein
VTKIRSFAEKTLDLNHVFAAADVTARHIYNDYTAIDPWLPAPRIGRWRSHRGVFMMRREKGCTSEF